MPFPPYFKNPLSDLVGTLLTHQDTRQCAEMEMKAINCLEAYGNVRGVNEKCTDLLKDYIECFQLKKQRARFEEMRNERFRQYRKRERSKKELYAEGPRVDSFQ
ncbi:uncharacterized protein [Rhodnius prolixus]|uniref:NADH-ubiquinone oxidoreductase 15 kDa subunit n=1 Tax=Rhodnius prolixus TaxID=13249 RepID=T1IEM5_RHOPR